ncbi:MAG TPA: glycosyltransferase family 4 protein [Actinomycetota bacterium]|nr:glycosyltransferase family 4 protein [Actinomycetota bacterium]
MVIVLDPDWIPRVRAVGARDAVFVPNGVEVPEQRAQIAPDNHRIAMVGMLNANKGSYVAVRAVGLARSRFPDIHLDLVGGGDTAGVQTLVTEVGIQGNVDVHGWLAPEEVDRLLDDSAMVILPSRREGIPMALLEAMSHGIPVVATPVGGIPRLLGDGRFGILTPVDDPVALAGAITGLLTDSEAARALGLRGRQQVADNYSLAVVTRQLREVLENLVS